MRAIQRNNTSGHPGVTWEEGRSKWKATIKIDGKLKNIGRYDTLEEAVEARKQAENEYRKL